MDYSNNAEKKLGSLRSQLGFTEVQEIIKDGLHEYLDTFQKRLNEVSIAIFETFFSAENIIHKI